MIAAIGLSALAASKSLADIDEDGDEVADACEGSRRLDFTTANFRDIQFSVKSPCSKATVNVDSQWSCTGCEVGPQSYTIALDKDPRTVPATTQGIEGECTGSAPAPANLSFSVSQGAHTLHIKTGLSKDSSCKLITTGYLKISR